ncbi:O-antigen ligase family protein [Marivirga sp.]|uniref:O-antigen ligase family protein n=1 Tax=Marivirga sp. TaxID=2018662 RepID=UPI002D7F9E1F|nr:O-antigen ligase family protein [Marivirga sp.]HET8858749.1 O-antigen ligase family protein [Marivirga sp.]
MKIERLLHDIIQFIVYLSIIGLIFLPIINSISLIACSALSIIYAWSYKKKVITIKSLEILAPTAGVFFIYFYGSFYSENIDQIADIMVKRLPLLFVPLILIVVNSQRPNFLIKFLNLLIGVILLLGLLNFMSNVIFDTDITNIPRSYLGMYYCGALIINYMIQSKIKQKISIHFLLLIFILSTPAKAPILIFLLVSMLLIYRELNLMKFIILASSIFISTFILINYHEDTKNRFLKLIHDSDYIRKRNWEHSLLAIKDNIYFGVGTGDGLTKLNEYRDKSWLEYYLNYNTHNQYLEIILTHGIFGLLLFLILLAISLNFAIKHHKKFYFIILLIFAIEFIIEVYLARQHGVTFYSYMLTIGLLKNE